MDWNSTETHVLLVTAGAIAIHYLIHVIMWLGREGDGTLATEDWVRDYLRAEDGRRNREAMEYKAFNYPGLIGGNNVSFTSRELSATEKREQARLMTMQIVEAKFAEEMPKLYANIGVQVATELALRDKEAAFNQARRESGALRAYEV